MADDQVRNVEAAIVAAYEAGRKVDDIEHEFGVGRSTIYHYLRRSGAKPNRRVREGAMSKDAALAGLYELIQLQDKRIEETERLLADANAMIRKLERQVARHNGAPASKRHRAG